MFAEKLHCRCVKASKYAHLCTLSSYFDQHESQFKDDFEDFFIRKNDFV